MSADLAALAPSVIVCVAFLVGGWVLLRRELAPKRRARDAADADAAADAADAASGEGAPRADPHGKSLYFTASADYVV
jgi:hypothetical protein